MPENLQTFLDALGSASKSVLGIVGYSATLVAWVLIAWRVRRHATLLKHIRALPNRDRLEAIRMEIGHIPVPQGLTAEQWIRARIHHFLLIGFVVLCVCAALIAVIALLHPTPVSLPSQSRTADSSKQEKLFQEIPHIRTTYLRFEGTVLLNHALRGFAFSPEDGFAIKPYWLKNGVYNDLVAILSSLYQNTASRPYDEFSLYVGDNHGKELWFADTHDGKLSDVGGNAKGMEKSINTVYPVAFPRRGPTFTGPQDVDDLFRKIESDQYWQIGAPEPRDDSEPIPFDGYGIVGLPDNQQATSVTKDPISRELLRANPERRDLIGFRVYCIHGQYYGEVWIREIKLLALDIENTGDQPIGLSGIKQKLIHPETIYKVRTLAANREALSTSRLEEYPLPIEALNPKEHLMIPLQIEFGFADKMKSHTNWNHERYIVDDLMPTKSWLKRRGVQIAFQILRSTDSSGNPRVDIRQVDRSALEEKPELASLIVPTYLIGQSIDVREVIFKTGNGVRTPKEVRRFDPNNLLAKGAYDAGSCPILAWKNAKSNEWHRFGPVLVNAVTSQRKMTESIPVDTSAAEFTLSEEENETSFLESIVLEAIDVDGRTYTFSPVGGELQAVRIGEFYKLEPGSKLKLKFSIPESMNFRKRRLLITGYYVPKALVSE